MKRNPHFPVKKRNKTSFIENFKSKVKGIRTKGGEIIQKIVDNVRRNDQFKSMFDVVLSIFSSLVSISTWQNHHLRYHFDD